MRGILWVLGFELCNWVSLRGQELGEIVSIRKNAWGLSVVMVTDTVIKSVSSFSVAVDFKKRKKNSLLYNYYIDMMRNIFGL